MPPSTRGKKGRTKSNELHIGRFIRWYASEGGAQLTIDSYRRVYWRAADWLSAHHKVALVDAQYAQLQEWREALTCSPRSAANYISALHLFFGEFLVGVVEYRLDDPAARVKRPKRIKKGNPDPVEEPDVFLALDAATHDPELFAWLMLYRYGGLRRMEVAGLRAGDLADRAGGGLWLTVRGKGGKVRRVPVAAEVASALRPFRGGQGPLFTKPSGKGYRPADVGERIRQHFAELDIQHVGHHLRHSFATRTLEVEPNIRKLQILLGHSSPETTAMYTLVEPEGAADSVDEMTARSLRDKQRSTLALVQGGRS